MVQLNNSETLHALAVLLVHLEETEGQIILNPEEKAIVEAVAKNVLNVDDSPESVDKAETDIKDVIINLAHKLKDEVINIFHHQKATAEAPAEQPISSGTLQSPSEPPAEAQEQSAPPITPETPNEPADAQAESSQAEPTQAPQQ